MNICEIACLECKKTEKSKKKIPSLHSAKLGIFPSRAQLCRVLAWHSAKWPNLCWVPALGKDFFFKKRKCRVPDTSALGEEFFKKKISFAECLTRRHSANGAVKLMAPVTFAEWWCGTRQILCRVPATWHSAKIPLPTTSLPSGLCREPHSAKPLPTAKVPLPSAAGTRQRRRIQ